MIAHLDSLPDGTASGAMGAPSLRPRFAGRARRPNRFRDAPTAAVLAEAECWLWSLAELDADLAADPASWDHPAETRAFVLAAVEDADAELARRERLRGHPEAPPWPGRWPDRRPVVAEIKAALDLPRVVEGLCGARLERRGRQFVCRCPLPGHDDATPSFSVQPEKRVWYCHGCHRGGDVFTLAMHMLGTDRFADVVPVLAAEAGIGCDGTGAGRVC